MTETDQTAERREVLADLSQWPHELHDVHHLNQYDHDEDRAVADVDTANVITSRISEGVNAGKHTIVLDIDVPARLVPSTTPGHSHLYIDVPLAWLEYASLLHELARLGVIERGYNAVAQHREHTAVRLPWIKKEAPADA